jgi:hypothetical protein
VAVNGVITAENRIARTTTVSAVKRFICASFYACFVASFYGAAVGVRG